jgi:hypothetical protein
MSGIWLAALILQSRRTALAALVLLAALIFGIALLYRRQTKRMRLRWRLTALTLRLGAVSALSLSLLQPVAMRKARPSEGGAVLIVVDHSHGMSHRDYADHPDQIVGLADGMGLLPPNVRSRGDEWVAMVAQLNQCAGDLSDAQSGLAFARISGRSTGDAEAQVAAATVRFDSAAQALLGRQPSVNSKSSLAKAIDAFNQVLQRPRNLGDAGDVSDTGEDWLAAVRNALGPVADAAATFQFEADQALYRTNPQVKKTCDALARLDRLGLVQTALSEPRTGLLAKLSPQIPLYGFAAGDDVTELPLRGPPLGHGPPVRRLVLDTDALGMNLTDAVRQAIERLGDEPIRAVVLFSTGRQPLERTTVFDRAAVGPPVFAVCTAPSNPRRGGEEQLAIGTIKFPSHVFTGQNFAVATKLQGVGFRSGARQQIWCEIDESLEIPLGFSPQSLAWNAAVMVASSPGDEQMTQSVPLSPDGTDVMFQVHIDQAGPHRISVGWPGIGGSQRWINVLEDPTPIALEAQTPTWDWRLARRVLARDPGFALRADIFADRALPLSPQDILQQKAMVIVDAQRQSLDASQQSALDQMVRQRGGLLILVGAPGNKTDVTSAATLLDWPVSSGWQTWPGTQAEFNIVPTPSSGAIWSPFAQWTSLPPIFRFVPLQSLQAPAQPLLIESNSASVVAAQMPVGRGHVIYLGLDEIWRWGFNAPAWFWPQLLRHFTTPPYAVSDGRLSLDADQASVSAGEEVNIRIRFVDAAGSPRDVPIHLGVLQNQAEVLTPSPRHVGQGEWIAKVSGLAAGSYRIRAIADDPDGRRALDEALQVLPKYQGEFQNAAAGRDELARLADTSHGRLLEMEQVGQLPALLDQAAITPTVEISLWDSAYLFIFVVACFCAEWALRKRMGLA